MSEVFQKHYATLYDLFYNEKDYIEECNMIEHFFENYVEFDVKSILDLGCGTANHSLELANRGYQVVGVDQSINMLDIARKKQKQNSKTLSLEFVHKNIEHIDFNKEFDVVLMMFAVICYINSAEKLNNVFKVIRKHLKTGGIFIFDFWYGPSVLHVKPSSRVKEYNLGDRIIKRKSTSNLDLDNNICNIDYELSEYISQKLVSTHTERHIIRYLFPDELEKICGDCSFELLNVAQFPEYNLKPTNQSWNVVSVVRAV